jgi:hypothetical protein
MLLKLQFKVLGLRIMLRFKSKLKVEDSTTSKTTWKKVSSSYSNELL